MDLRLDLVWVLSHESIRSPVGQTLLDVKGHGDQIEEWFEAFVNIIEVRIWRLWETEEDFSIVELLYKVVSLVDIFVECKGLHVEFLRLVEALKFFDSVEVILELDNLLVERFFFCLKLGAHCFVSLGNSVLTISESCLNL